MLEDELLVQRLEPAHAPTPKNGRTLREGVEEHVDLVGRVVERRRGAHGCRQPEARVQRRGAVVPDAHRDAAGVEELPDVVRVHAVDVEGGESDALGPGASPSSRTPAISRSPSRSRRSSSRSWACTASIPTRVEVAHRGGQADRLRHRLRARLEPLRRRKELGAVEADRA